MSEKRFKLINGVRLGTHSGIWDNRKQHNMGIGDELWVGEVVAMLNKGVALAEENKELKTQLYCEGSVCNICKHQQLTPDKVMQGYYTSKCEKGHKDCSKEDLKHCKDFKLEELSE